MINRSEELPDIALEHPAGFGMVLAFLKGEFLKAFNGFVRAFVVAAGIGVGNEGLVEEWIEDAIERMVQESVAQVAL